MNGVEGAPEISEAELQLLDVLGKGSFGTVYRARCRSVVRVVALGTNDDESTRTDRSVCMYVCVCVLLSGWVTRHAACGRCRRSCGVALCVCAAQTVAVKVLERSLEPKTLAAFRGEVSILVNLRHPNLCLLLYVHRICCEGCAGRMRGRNAPRGVRQRRRRTARRLRVPPAATAVLAPTLCVAQNVAFVARIVCHGMRLHRYNALRVFVCVPLVISLRGGDNGALVCRRECRCGGVVCGVVSVLAPPPPSSRSAFFRASCWRVHFARAVLICIVVHVNRSYREHFITWIGGPRLARGGATQWSQCGW